MSPGQSSFGLLFSLLAASVGTMTPPGGPDSCCPGGAAARGRADTAPDGLLSLRDPDNKLFGPPEMWDPDPRRARVLLAYA
jgi:hypothetical protein